ncbi:MFS transporter [Rothia terrae]|uniref:MFS transporter n=1 Tax=Rothia terrae TaxID=396015 RepID=A0A7H2BGG8_9MICC|nr:MFS transporter [Rothia terrae]QNV38764.1 MFS transporter [Rothia terrae]
MALISTTLGIGGSTGIPLGGVFASLWGWESLFWISAGLAAVSLALMAILIPHREPHARQPFDYIGAFLLSAALILILLGISQGKAWGWTSLPILGSLVGGLLLAVLFVCFEARKEAALVNIEVNAQRPIMLTNAASLLMGIAMFTNLLVTSLHLQGTVEEHGFAQNATVAGLAMVPSAIIMFFMPAITSYLVNKFGAEQVLIGGGLLTAAAYLLRAMTSIHITMVIIWAMVASAGVALTYAVFPLLIMANASHHHTAATNGLNALIRAIGTTVASAAVAAISATFLISHNDTSSTSWTGILAIFGIGAVASLLAAVCGWAVKKPADN